MTAPRLRAVISDRHVLVDERRRIRGRGRHRLRGLRGGLLLFERGALLLEPNFLLQRALQLVRGFLEFGEALAERPAELGELAGAKNDQSDHENDDQLRHADGTKHRTPAFKKPRARDSRHYRNGVRYGSRN